MLVLFRRRIWQNPIQTSSIAWIHVLPICKFQRRVLLGSLTSKFISSSLSSTFDYEDSEVSPFEDPTANGAWTFVSAFRWSYFLFDPLWNIFEWVSGQDRNNQPFRISVFAAGGSVLWFEAYDEFVTDCSPNRHIVSPPMSDFTWCMQEHTRTLFLSVLTKWMFRSPE